MSLKIDRRQPWLQVFPLHVFLFAIYPILALLAINISEVDPSSAWRSVLLAIVAAGLLTLAFYAIFRDWGRAALLSTIALILFYSYGHVYILLKEVNLGGFYFFRHRTLIPVWIV